MIVVIIGVFVFSLQQEIAPPLNAEGSQQPQPGYPGPIQSNEPVVASESINAYPGPTESTNSASTSSTCIQNPPWETFTDQDAGYSLSFPSSARLSQIDTLQEYDNIQIVLYSSCFDSSCLSSDTIELIIWENSDNLSIKDFVEQRLAEGGSATEELAKLDVPFDILKNGGQYMEIANKQAIRIQDTNRSIEISMILGLANPRVFVPHGDLVLEIYVAPPDAHQTFTPCRSTLKQFDQILDSLQLFAK
jgi:hypothetical protein